MTTIRITITAFKIQHGETRAKYQNLDDVGERHETILIKHKNKRNLTNNKLVDSVMENMKPYMDEKYKGKFGTLTSIGIVK